jgi:hypothetical protein
VVEDWYLDKGCGEAKLKCVVEACKPFFNNDGEFELKKGGFFVNTKDNFIILKSSDTQQNLKSSYWKISDKTPIFCKLNDNDKMILVLMEKIV